MLTKNKLHLPSFFQVRVSSETQEEDIGWENPLESPCFLFFCLGLNLGVMVGAPAGGKSQENLNPAVLQVLETYQQLLCSRGSRGSEKGHCFLSLSHDAWASPTGSRTQWLTADLPVRRALSPFAHHLSM